MPWHASLPPAYGARGPPLRAAPLLARRAECGRPARGRRPRYGVLSRTDASSLLGRAAWLGCLARLSVVALVISPLLFACMVGTVSLALVAICRLARGTRARAGEWQQDHRAFSADIQLLLRT